MFHLNLVQSSARAARLLPVTMEFLAAVSSRGSLGGSGRNIAWHREARQGSCKGATRRIVRLRILVQREGSIVVYHLH